METFTVNPYQSYIALSRYARWRDDLGRRETWGDTVDRWKDFWLSRFPEHSETIEKELAPAILNLETMPSMRSLMTAGRALDRDNVAGYNCSYTPIDSPRRFDEIAYILMCGVGVGFSVERQEIVKLPEVSEELHNTDTVIKVRDSKIGWASALRELISLLYSGKVPKWDTSSIRPAGSRLKTFGGRASGPEPLEDLFSFVVSVFRHAKGRKLTSLECHDIVCKIADIVVVGGVRRSALISLSNLSDDRMRKAKSGQWWMDNVQRALANNSACYTEKPDLLVFLDEWKSLIESKSGERGIFNRVAAKKQAESTGRRDSEWDFGVNPCGEIILRPRQFCNLSEVVVRPDDTLDDLKNKVRLATILGTLQSTLTSFRYLSKDWKSNTEEERLLGVSLTGIMDHPTMSNTDWSDPGTLEKWLQELKNEAINTNVEWSNKLGINPSTSITCVKPSGTVSQLVNSSSGIHPRYSEYYIRTVRADKKDPLAKFMVDKGFPYEDDVTKPDHNYVFSFPIKSPDSAIFRDTFSALDQLELWKIYRDNWCEHNPSITVYVKDDEWLDVGAWIYRNFDSCCGLTLLPYTDHIYKQAPYQELTEYEYEKLESNVPKDIDWTELSDYEKTDNTTASHELACSAAGGCEI